MEHLVNIATVDDAYNYGMINVYILGPGVKESDLTETEKALLEFSKLYMKWRDDLK